MAKPNLNDYIFVTRKNFLSDDNEGRTVEKSFLEIQGIFFVKIHDNTFNGTIGENAVEHIENFLKVVKPLKIKGVSHDRVRLSVFPISLGGAASEWFKKDCIGSVTTWEEADEDDNPDDIAEIFKIEGNLFDFETPLCKTFNKFNYLLKIDTNLFTFDIQEIGTYKDHEYEFNNNMTRDLEEPYADIDGFCNGRELPGIVRVGCMTYFQDHKWYDELADGVLKEETLIHKAKFEESWGDATPRVIKFRAWLKNSFENFHELDHDILVKLEECWWKEHKKEHYDPSICRVRRFRMMKYSFDADDEYVAIKEHEHFNHLRTNIDACQACRELFRIIDEGWLMTKDLIRRHFCKEIDDLVYSGKRRVLNSYGNSDASSTHFCSRTQIG
ncbi:hypothetical protein Tco_0907565 [Tanacetum coccineum]|uniref:Uncharacterized protein n=1 Tax=Tanacetum coccineum TaxID=301880 RepID=A0ABQ5CJY9_9ASTR